MTTKDNLGQQKTEYFIIYHTTNNIKDLLFALVLGTSVWNVCDSSKPWSLHPSNAGELSLCLVEYSDSWTEHAGWKESTLRFNVGRSTNLMYLITKLFSISGILGTILHAYSILFSLQLFELFWLNHCKMHVILNIPIFFTIPNFYDLHCICSISIHKCYILHIRVCSTESLITSLQYDHWSLINIFTFSLFPKFLIKCAVLQFPRFLI